MVCLQYAVLQSIRFNTQVFRVSTRDPGFRSFNSDSVEVLEQRVGNFLGNALGVGQLLHRSAILGFANVATSLVGHFKMIFKTRDPGFRSFKSITTGHQICRTVKMRDHGVGRWTVVTISELCFQQFP